MTERRRLPDVGRLSFRELLIKRLARDEGIIINVELVMPVGASVRGRAIGGHMLTVNCHFITAADCERCPPIPDIPALTVGPDGEFL